MSDMVEKVARAICRAEGHDPDHNYDPQGLAQRLEIRWMLYDHIARSAIEAMRDPDHDMTGAVVRWGDDRTALMEQWGKMIDEALK